MSGEAEDSKHAGDSLWARLPVIALMALVLLAAGLLSAITAMRLTIRGEEVVVPALVGAVRQLVHRSLVFPRPVTMYDEGGETSDGDRGRE